MGIRHRRRDIGGEMAVPHPLPDDLVELIAERFRALSEPTRIKLLDRLREGEATVLDLTELIGTTQQNVSKHLGVLQQSGIVARRTQGNFAYYRIVDEGRLRPLRGGLRQPAGAGRFAQRAHRRGEHLMLAPLSNRSQLYQPPRSPPICASHGQTLSGGAGRVVAMVASTSGWGSTHRRGRHGRSRLASRG
jgi:DNA-binding transcriptional ArsR family regulator